jgi:hypothetical protein
VDFGLFLVIIFFCKISMLGHHGASVISSPPELVSAVLDGFRCVDRRTGLVVAC